MNIGHFLALEEAAFIETEIEQPPTDDVPVETDLLETQELEGEINDGLDDVQALGDDAETLTDIADTLEEAGPDGAEPQALQMAEIAVEAIYDRWNLSKKKLPSLESINGTEARRDATIAVMEDIKEKAASIGKAILAAIKRIWDTVVEFISNLFDVQKKLIERAKGVAAKAKGLTGQPEKEVKGAFLKRLANDSGVSPASVLDNLKHAADLAKSMDKWDNSVYLNEFLEILHDKEAFLSYQLSNPPSTFEALTKMSSTGTFKQYMGWFRDTALTMPGGNYLAIHYPLKGYKGEDALILTTAIQARVVKDPASVKEVDEAQALAPNNIADICTGVAHVMEGVMRNREKSSVGFKNYMKVFGSNQTAAFIAAQGGRRLDGSVGKYILFSSVVHQGSLALLSTLARRVTFVVSELTSLSKASLDYCEASMAAYGEIETADSKAGGFKPQGNGAKALPA